MSLITSHTVDRSAAVRRVAEFNAPDRVRVFGERGTDLVMGRREGYKFWDVDGREFHDFHLNGGTYNLGHRHPELVELLRDALDHVDMGNHHLPSDLRGRVAERLVAMSGPQMRYAVFAPSGGEANDVAIKSARRATGRRRIVTVNGGYHGRTGLSGASGDATNARSFLSDLPDEFAAVPFNDVDALARELERGDVAAFLVEVIPATLGFPLPDEDYYLRVKELCRSHGTVLIADEVQTGLLRSGEMWACTTYGVEPDIIVTGKGLGGGLYPVAAVILNEWAGEWVTRDGWGYVSTAGGAELGMCVALGVLDILERPSTRPTVLDVASAFETELEQLVSGSDFVTEIRQRGVIIAIKTDHPEGGRRLNRACFERGLWAYPSGFDPSVLQFKAGLLFPLDDVPDVMSRLTDAAAAASQEV